MYVYTHIYINIHVYVFTVLLYGGWNGGEQGDSHILRFGERRSQKSPIFPQKSPILPQKSQQKNLTYPPKGPQSKYLISVTHTSLVLGGAGCKRAVYSRKRAVYSRKRACQRAPRTRHRAHSLIALHQRLTPSSFREVQVAEEPYVPKNEFYIPAKECKRALHSRKRVQKSPTYLPQSHQSKGPLLLPKSPTSSQTSAIHLQRNPKYLQKNPVYPQNSSVFSKELLSPQDDLYIS